MANLNPPPYSNEALPRIPGPKLEPFRWADPQSRNITFISYLGEGLHGHAYKVDIDGTKYALKIVSIF
jgi:hypothetical protein